MGGAATVPLLNPHSHQTSSPRRAGARSNPFPVGSAVEVRTDEEDFRCTYFSATVISPAAVSLRKGNKKKSKVIEVEYHTLFEQVDGSKRLREKVDVSCVRPSPPLEEVLQGFEPGDAVDAFFQEGWWIGSVARVVEGAERRYAVTFHHPPDEREFGVSELRVHWDWVAGSWVRPDRKSLAGLMFDVGRKVEVSFDKENHKGAWFPGTIHQSLGNETYLVECRGVSSNVNSTEIVDSRHLRPWPPSFKYKNFVLLEKVDAFFDFGWWSGIIKQEFENGIYLVFFKVLNMEKKFNQSQLRPQMDWKDEKWFTSSKDITNPSSEGGVHEQITCENPSASVSTVPLNNLGDGKDPCGGKASDQVDDSPGFQKTPYVTSLTKRRKHLSDSHIARSEARKNVKEGNALGVNQDELHDVAIKEMISDFVSPVSGKIVNTVDKQSATADRSSDNTPGVKRTMRMQRNVGGTINSTSKAKNSRAQKSPIENQELDIEGKEPDGVGYTAENVENDHTKQEFGTPVIIGLPCAEMGSSGFGFSKRKTHGSISKVIMKIGSEEKKQLDDSTTKKIETKKRGRPRKIPIKSIETLATDDLNEKDDDPRIIPEVDAIVMETLPVPNQEKTTLNKDTPINGPSDTNNTKRTSSRKRREVVVESTNPQENNVPKRGRRRSTIPQVQDLLGASEGKSMEVNSTLEVNIVCEAPSHEFENQPLSKWIEGINNPSAVDVSTEPSPMIAAEEQPIENREKNHIDIEVLDKVSEKQQASEVSIPTMVDKHSVVLVEPQNLPFVKNTLLWKTVETMEAFQRIPQSPHFQPLEDIKESLREGKAIGYMVTFAGVVGQISKLQFDDSKDVTDEMMETLAELEKYGFNVRPIQDRVAELLAVKEKESNLLGDVNELNDRILERHQEKDKIQEEMDAIKEEIRKLEERFSAAESAKEKEEDELVVLADRMKETEESIENTRRDFEVHPKMVIRNSSENPFRKGAQVEVSLEDEGFRGSWYAATVLRAPPKKASRNPRILLQFHTLTDSVGDENRAAEPLRERVSLILARPIPPREPRRRFCVSEEVDAFHNDGWWEGVVMAVVDGGDLYSVFFRSSREQIDFPESQLRLHREWVHGEWVPPLEDDNARAPLLQLPPSKVELAP